MGVTGKGRFALLYGASRWRQKGQRDQGMMRYDEQFGLFEDGEAGPVWRGFFASLDEATLHAQALADKEGQAFFVFNLKDSSEAARVVSRE